MPGLFIHHFFNNAVKEKIQTLLYGDLSSAWMKLEKHAIDDLHKTLIKDLLKKVQAEKITADEEIILLNRLISQLQSYIREESKTIKIMQVKYAEYSKRYKYATSDSDKKQYILEFAKEIDAHPAKLEADKRAQSLWFDHDAITDRFYHHISKQEKRLTFTMSRLARLITQYIKIHGREVFTLQQWLQFELEGLLLPLFNYNGDERVRVSAFKVMTQCVRSLDESIQTSAFAENILRYIYRSALDQYQNVWIQTEALTLLSTLSADNFKLVFLQRFNNNSNSEDIFVKHHAVMLLENYYQHSQFSVELIDIIIQEKSPYVRQAISHIINIIPVETRIDVYEKLLFKDPSPQVRAALLLTLVKTLREYPRQTQLLAVIRQLFDKESDLFVIRILLDQLPLMIKTLSVDKHLQEQWRDAVFPLLGEMQRNSPHTKLRRWAAKCREWIWCYSSPERTQILQTLQNDVVNLYDKDTIKTLTKISGKNQGEKYADEISRLLSLLAQNSDGFDLDVKRKGFKLYKKPLFVFRWWRTLYEFKHSSIDKRQAYSHTIGRLSRGKVYIPSAIKAELSMTKVPGEPFYFADEDGWRPFLPLVDDILSLLDPLLIAPPIKIVSADGITIITPPANPVKRLAALSVVTARFDYFARLRNWEEGMQTPANEYIDALKKLGIEFQFTAHEYAYDPQAATDSSINRFLGAAVPLPFLDMFSRFKDYFYSVYENNLTELLIFLTLGSSYFIGRHIVVNRMISSARKSMGIVIGGWGTRGKSGTERLKAGLFNALGFNVISKTTGCEAMFLNSYSYGTLREMFLFRPYDKATIWEQGDVLRLAQKMDTDVFLWECMGLTPSYVEILQRQWMQDDISTITNTYPDHEDLQGPAGHNIPEVMTRFIPQKSILITSEDQMLPVLEKEAVQQNTRFVSVGWKEAGLLTDDVLSRFPYDEHPYNIALVLAMAREFDISEVFALKEMADRVVPDLGVLKSYPRTQILSRHLTFVMGMSANERFGALGNWKRMGFDSFTVDKNPQLWVSVLINNRADRIPRSRVFADLLVNDISVDAVYLIGTNLYGFMGYLRESWAAQKGSFTLQAANQSALQLLQGFAVRFRIPDNEQLIIKRLSAMLSGLNATELLNNLEQLWQDKDELNKQLNSLQYGQQVRERLEHELSLLNSYNELRQMINSGAASEQLDQQLEQLLWHSFQSKIVIIEDEHASGDEIINSITEHTPPGLENKIMGMQNIKGTGLDFVYRWLAWDYCYTALEQLNHEKPDIAREGLKQLVTFQEYSVLCEAKVTEVIHEVKQLSWAQRENIQAELELIETRMNNSLENISQASGKQELSSRWKLFIINIIEELLDTGDAVKRRKKADLIYKELIHQRISYARAALELKNLNSRQKGGWLSKKLLK